MHLRLLYLRVQRQGESMEFDSPYVIKTLKQTPVYVTVEAKQRVIDSHDYEVSISGVISNADRSILDSWVDKVVGAFAVAKGGHLVNGEGVLRPNGDRTYSIKGRGTESFIIEYT